MILWLDAHLSPELAPWLAEQFDIEVHAVRDIGFKNAKDHEIFMAARRVGAVLMSKDSDFLILLDHHGPPPQILWLTCGNTSNDRLKAILRTRFKKALRWLRDGERLIEIGDVTPSARRR